MKNVVLIGMPGAGKSTVGVVLAKTLGMNFVDTDLLIQAETGQKLQEIINEKGSAAFLAIENDVVKRLSLPSAVVATGGSVIFGPEAMQSLKKNGVILYIRLSAETIADRLKNIQTRGIAMPPGMTIADLYAQRAPLYEQYADVVAEAEGKSLEETVTLLVQLLDGKL